MDPIPEYYASDVAKTGLKNEQEALGVPCGECPVEVEVDPFGAHQRVDRAAVRKLVIAIVLCTVFMVVEIAGGFLSGSLAIMTDAAHLLSDLAGFLISLFAVTWSRRRASASMSFGYHRAEILGALLSISLVWAMTFYLLMEAVERLRNPHPIDGRMMFAVAAFGLVVNAIIGFVLHEHTHAHTHAHIDYIGEAGLASSPNSLTAANGGTRKRGNINVRAAFVHAIGDVIQSVGVLVAATMVWARPEWAVADPLCTFLFSILVVASTWFLARDTILILMEGTPEDVCPRSLQRELTAVDGVLEVHDLHVWSLAPGKVSATVHIVIDWPRQVSDAFFYGGVLEECQKTICRHNIHHTTIQVDQGRKADLHCRTNCCGSEENFLTNGLSPHISAPSR